jgi:transposase
MLHNRPADQQYAESEEALMRKQLYWLSEQEWRRIEPLLPRGRRGAHRVDDRRVISGIIYMLRTGARWRAVHRNMGPTRRSTIASIAGAGRRFG